MDDDDGFSEYDYLEEGYTPNPNEFSTQLLCMFSRSRDWKFTVDNVPVALEYVPDYSTGSARVRIVPESTVVAAAAAGAHPDRSTSTTTSDSTVQSPANDRPVDPFPHGEVILDLEDIVPAYSTGAQITRSTPVAVAVAGAHPDRSTLAATSDSTVQTTRGDRPVSPETISGAHTTSSVEGVEGDYIYSFSGPSY